MTDREALYSYRLGQAEETLQDAHNLLADGSSPRSIINRAYYSMFYAVLALFIHSDVLTKTSKHAGIIALFDKEFVHKETIDKHYSRILREAFEARQVNDYKDFMVPSREDGEYYLGLADEFVSAIKTFISNKG